MHLVGESIVISGQALAYLKNSLESRSYTKVVVLVDENTKLYCLPKLQGLYDAVIEIASGETNKNIQTAEKIWTQMAELGMDRHSVLLNLGGGVIGDMGGFCAATYMRGIDFIQLPTTLLAMVDASCGGKLGIDLHGLKNYVGLFYEANWVFIQPDFLDTLPERQFYSGWVEMVKHALIADESNLSDLLKLNPGRMKTLIQHSVEIKNELVQLDFFEKKERKALNFGHTVGHAIESFFLGKPNALLHGEAVAYGLLIESILSKQIGLTDEAVSKVFGILQTFIPFRKLAETDCEALFALMQKDKKNLGAKINMTLLENIAQVVLDVSIDITLFEQAVKEFNQRVEG